MTTPSARFTQSPTERKRYVLDYTLFLSGGEEITNVTFAVTQNSGVASPALLVDGVALTPANPAGFVIGVAFFASAGVNNAQYEITFLATTSVGQILEDVVIINLLEKT
jgi:hypothetical protein